MSIAHNIKRHTNVMFTYLLNFYTHFRHRTAEPRPQVKAKFHYAIQLANQLASCSQTWFLTGRRQVRAISTCPDSSKLVTDLLASRIASDRSNSITLSSSLAGQAGPVAG